MNILELTGEPLFHGGQEKFITNLVQYMDDPSIVMDVLTPYSVDNDSFCELIEEHNGKVYSFDYEFVPGSNRKVLMKPLKDFLKSKNYDAVHIHSGSISFLAYAAETAKEVGIRKIIVHSHATGIDNLKHRIVRRVFGPKIKSNATDFLACSYKAGLDKYPKSIMNNKLVIIQNGINVQDYARDNDIRIKQRDALGIPQEAFVVGHVGRFTFEKNHTFLISAFEKYYKENPDSYLLLVGDGDLMTECKRITADKGLDSCIMFTGNVENVQDYYQVMDVFVLPSIYEGLPFVALESQAAGLPCIISTGVPEAAEIGSNVKRIPLDEALWVQEIAAARTLGISDNTALMKEAGYEVADTVKQIKKIYKS